MRRDRTRFCSPLTPSRDDLAELKLTCVLFSSSTYQGSRQHNNSDMGPLHTLRRWGDERESVFQGGKGNTERGAEYGMKRKVPRSEMGRNSNSFFVALQNGTRWSAREGSSRKQWGEKTSTSSSREHVKSLSFSGSDAAALRSEVKMKNLVIVSAQRWVKGKWENYESFSNQFCLVEWKWASQAAWQAEDDTSMSREGAETALEWKD